MLEMRIDGYLCTRNAEGVNRMIFPFSYYPLSYSQEARYTSHECKSSQGLAFTTQRKLLQVSSKKAALPHQNLTLCSLRNTLSAYQCRIFNRPTPALLFLANKTGSSYNALQGSDSC
jgi:hypothetical protein